MKKDLFGLPQFMVLISNLRKDFWMEPQDVFGLTFPKWRVGHFN